MQRQQSSSPLGRSSRRVYLGGTIATIGGALGLAACGPTTGAPQGGASPPASREPATIRMGFPAGAAESTIEARQPDFAKRYPHLTLAFEPSGEYLAKLATQFASDTAPDVVFLESDDEAFYGFWAAKGTLTQLDPFVARDKVDLKVFLPQAIEALRVVDGKLWAYPYTAFMARCGLFYNKTLFDKNGIKVPTDDWTYDQIAATAKRLTQRAGTDVQVWGGGRKFGGDLAVMAVTRPFGGGLYSQDGKKTLINSKGSQEAISWWLDRSLKDQSVANDLVVKNPLGQMPEGKVAFAMGYNPGDRITMARTMDPAGQEWGLALMPKGPAGRRGGAFFNTPLGMAKITKHPDATWEVLKFMAEKETGVVAGLPKATTGQRSSHFGARKDVYS
ncbi:MAG TPA: extracellular solute-binding protein, partial [Chloroflexota bacterium]|nr:extracellular solute-binding protein [Chloroflexota bacterium]